MDECQFTLLENRALIAVSGEDAREFLQGLVSNDIHRVGPDRAVYSALLTPQGKFLHDFFVTELNGELILDCEAGRADDLSQRLTMFKLRAKVQLTQADFKVAAAFGPDVHAAFGLSPGPGSAGPFHNGCAYVDPRLTDMGVRAVLSGHGAAEKLESLGLTATGAETYDALRLSHGLPDGSRDIDVDKSTLLECGFEELNGVDFDKGCYMGQELTARTRYRGLVKRRLFPVDIEGPLPEPGATINFGKREAGTVKSGTGGRAIALLRLEAIAEARASGTPLRSGDAVVIPVEPKWMIREP